MRFLGLKRAFTLVELLVVIVIVGLLSAVAIGVFLKQQSNVTDKRAKHYLAEAWKAEMADYLDNQSGFGTTSTDLMTPITSRATGLTVSTGTSYTAATGKQPNDVIVDTTASNSSSITFYAAGSKNNIWMMTSGLKNGEPTIKLVGDLLSLAPTNLNPPSITGTPGVGVVLTSDKGSWLSALALTYVFQWQRCNASGGACVDIAAANSSSYTVNLAADNQKTLRVKLTATNANGSASAFSTTTSQIQAGRINAPAPTALPIITGTAQEGSTLNVSNGTWSVPITTYTYQWYHCDAGGSNCVIIPAATSSSYALTYSDTSFTMRAAVNVQNGDGYGSATSNQTASVTGLPPSVSVSPTVSGTAQDTQTLTASQGTWLHGPTGYTYQWQRCNAAGASCADIASATSNTYVVIPTDVGATLRVVVSATNIWGTTAGPSAVTSVVTPTPPVNTSVPTESGTAKEAQTLTATSGSWTGTPTITYAYQWQTSPDGSTSWTNLSGATSTTYVLQSSDVGKYIRIQVTGTNACCSVAAVSSASAKVVSGVPIGAIVATTDNSGAPAGWLYADGSCVSQATYAALFTAQGATYDTTGCAGGQFRLPQLMGNASGAAGGRFPMGQAASGTGATLGAIGGTLNQTPTVTLASHTHTWTLAAHSHTVSLGAHSHTFSNFQRQVKGSSTAQWGLDATYTLNALTASTSTGNDTESASDAARTQTGSIAAFNPPYLVVNYIIKALSTAGLPCGGIWGQASASAPAGSYLANGQAVSRSGESALYACTGTAFGAGDGSTTFNLPDLRGKFPLGKSNSGTASAFASTGGALDNSPTLTVNDVAHSITITGNTHTSQEQGANHSVSGPWSTNGGGSCCGTGSPSIGPNPGAPFWGSSNSESGNSAINSSGDPGQVVASSTNATVPLSPTASSNPPFMAINYVVYSGTSYSMDPGTIIPYISSSAPAGWLVADGSCVNQAGAYANLYAAIGTTYTPACAGGQFRLPDLRQRLPLAKAASGTGSVLGGSGGAIDATFSYNVPSHTHSLTVANHTHSWSFPNHNHTIPCSNSCNGGGPAVTSLIWNSMSSSQATSSSNGGQTVGDSGGGGQTITSSASGGQSVTSSVVNPSYQTFVFLIKY
jgi:prepilin-type N-terminal cleavage/methylation domain-containing protein